jgi:hypothetical protein
MKSEKRRAGYAGFFRMEELSASLLSSRSRLFGKACTPCTNLPGSMSHNTPLKAFEETGEVCEESTHAAHIFHECCTSWEKLSTNVLMTVCWLVGKISQFFGGVRRCEPQQHLMAVGHSHAHHFAALAHYTSPVGKPCALLGERAYLHFAQLSGWNMGRGLTIVCRCLSCG